MVIVDEFTRQVASPFVVKHIRVVSEGQTLLNGCLVEWCSHRFTLVTRRLGPHRRVTLPLAQLLLLLHALSIDGL